MDLVLIRHAIAEERDLTRWPDDAMRPLTADGEARFRRAARGLARLVPSVDRVLASPFVRAWRTAEIMAEEGGWPGPEPAEVLAAGRSPLEVAEALSVHASEDRVAVVGHEPTLSEVASLLLSGGPTRVMLEFKKGAACMVALPQGPDPGEGMLRWLLSPKVLRDLAG